VAASTALGRRLCHYAPSPAAHLGRHPAGGSRHPAPPAAEPASPAAAACGAPGRGRGGSRPRRHDPRSRCGRLAARPAPCRRRRGVCACTVPLPARADGVSGGARHSRGVRAHRGAARRGALRRPRRGPSSRLGAGQSSGAAVGRAIGRLRRPPACRVPCRRPGRPAARRPRPRPRRPRPSHRRLGAYAVGGPAAGGLAWVRRRPRRRSRDGAGLPWVAPAARAAARGQATRGRGDRAA